MNKNHKSFVCGIKGKYLSNEEKRFLIKYKPWGIILFSRNIKSIKQAKILTNSIKKIFKNENYPILIDQEGGCVTRLKKFIDTSIFSAKFFGDLYKKNNKKFEIYFNVYVKQISYLLKTLGININSVPVLDIRRVKSHKIIGDRSYSANKKIVSKIGDICIEKFHKNRIATIIKHIPGHGLAGSDSHKKLPIINQKIEYLLKNDFQAFKNKNSLIAMTGHLLFKNIDNNDSVTHSKKIIKLIRNKIGFKNIIISDDISMKALKNSIKINTLKSFAAGCNLILHCNANYAEMRVVAENSPLVNNFIIKKTSQFYRFLS